jgi:hypothetical protein
VGDYSPIESDQEMRDRLEMMAAGDPTWDLSDNDKAAIAWVLERDARLRGLEK